jgi:hypothetical protein
MNQPSSPVQAVLELFQGPLAEVRFADVDAARLADAARVLDAAAAAVAEQEAQLAELRQTLADRQDALLVLAQRALAYARVYAEHDEALSEQLSRITLPRASKPRKASSKAVGTEASATPEPAVEIEPAAETEVPEVEAHTEAPAAEAPAPRKGKRRASEAHGRENTA